MQIKYLLLFLPIFLSGCFLERSVSKLYLDAQNECTMSGYSVVQVEGYETIFRCTRDLSEKDKCINSCTKIIKNAYGSLNDTRGNIGGFPDSVSKTLDTCLEKCY